jgi:hypothetical protein
MKCPRNSPLMWHCYEEAFRSVNSENKDWNLPIKILNDNINKFDLGKCIVEISNQDSWFCLRKMFLGKYSPAKHWYALHLINEEWRRNKLNKEAIPNRSLIGRLKKIYLKQNKYRYNDLLMNYYRFIFPIRLVFPNKGLMPYLKEVQWQFIRIFWKTVRLIKKESI